MPSLLTSTIGFPDPRSANREGLVAIGGDLQPARLLSAYRQGIYPWSVNPVTWWSPDPRGIIELEEFHVSKSLTKFIRKGVYDITMDKAFREVIHACAQPGQNRHQTWISPEFIEAYTRLHEMGHAHSVECWLDGKLVGGIYGVVVGGAFAGESMFHTADNASKVALHYLVEHLRARQFALFDIQMVTAATKPMGAKNIPRMEYLTRLADAVSLNCSF